MPFTKLLAVVSSLASAVVVRDAAEFRAELARGAPSIELADNLYLEGEELNVTAPCVIDGRGYVLQNDARHFRASAPLDLRNITLVRAGYAPTPSPTCAPTPVAEEAPVDPLELVDIFDAGVGTCDDTNKWPARSAAGGGRQRPLIIILLDRFPQHAAAAIHRDTKVKGPAAPRSGRACATPSRAGS